MAGVMRGIEGARRATLRATVRVWDSSKTNAEAHRGQGLLLDLDGEGTVVLTCHHVIAPVEREHLCVKIPRANDLQLGEPISARYDPKRSRPEQDAVVLRVDGPRLDERPLLHRLDMERYDGSLEANVRTHLQPDNFDATVRPVTPLDIPAESSGYWPDPHGRYNVRVFRLASPGNAKPGISGGVVLCEGGVLGLVHFSRKEDPRFSREGYLVPLTVWAEGWPALDRLIGPLIDKNLRDAATVKRSGELEIGLGDDVSIAEYRGDLYLEREADRHARAALERPGGGVVIVGKPKSGKTRLAWELLRGRPDALVVIPDHYSDRPPAFEPSGFAGDDVVLFFDDLHLVAQTADPLQWRRRFEEASGRRCLLICTSRDGDEWDQVTDRQSRFLGQIGRDAVVFTSRVGEPREEDGEDLSEEQKLQLARNLGLSEEEAGQRFDGTPGSLLLDLDEMGLRYKKLRDDELPRGEVPMSQLLDAAKLLNATRQPGFRDQILRAVAEEILGNGPMSHDTWRTLRRYTQRYGFGRFDDAHNFQTYRPYLEQCVPYTPSRKEIERLQPILCRENDHEGLFYLAVHWQAEENHEQALNCYERAVALRPEFPEAWNNKGNQLGRLGRHEEAVGAYEEALRYSPDFPEAWLNKGTVLGELGRHEEAVGAHEEALRYSPDFPEAWLGKGSELGRLGRPGEALRSYEEALRRRPDFPEAWNKKGLALNELGQHEEALKAHEEALRRRPDFPEAWLNKGVLLGRLGRPGEALRSYEEALRRRPDFPEAWLGKGNELGRLGRPGEALKAYKEALRRRPDFPGAWHGKGIALANLERYDEAVGCLCRAWHLWEDFPDYRSIVAKALKQLGHDAEECEFIPFRAIDVTTPPPPPPTMSIR